MNSHLDTSVIPKGCYCYTYIDNKYYCCPYWSLNQNYPYQLNGFCKYLNSGDWENENRGFSLLWDQVKECGINDFTEQELLEMWDEQENG